MDDRYMAGIIDGEGCIRLVRQRRGTYSVTVELTMSYKALPLMEKVQRTYGGNLISQKRDDRSATRAACWSWRLTSKKSVDFLRRMQPFLIIKQEHADLALWFHERVNGMPRATTRGAPWSEEQKELGVRAFARMSALNRTGPEVKGIPGREPFAILEGSGWVSPQMSFEPLADQYTGPWPTSGMATRGRAYQLPDLILPPAAPGCSSLLPTPRATRGGSATETVSLLPTPTPNMLRNEDEDVADWQERRARVKVSARNGNGFGVPLTKAVQLLPTPACLLPTPTAQDGANLGGPSQHGRNSLPLNVIATLLAPSAGTGVPTPRPSTPGTTPPAASLHLFSPPGEGEERS